MAITLPNDFNEFLRLLNEHQVEYLLVGGFAVSYHGYPRATDDIDVLVRRSQQNAERIVLALREFGFDTPNLSASLFLDKNKIVRMGNPPLRIELLTSIDGVEFASCAANQIVADFDGTPVPVISLDDLKTNKRSSGRHRDLDDLEHLP